MKTRNVSARMEHLTEIMDFIETFLENPAYSEKTKYHILVSVEELFTNIASYAYGEESGAVEVSCGYVGAGEKEMLRICFKDWGVPYNPLERQMPDFNIPFEKRATGGLGVYMARTFMDRVEYCYEDGCNVLTIEKSL